MKYRIIDRQSLDFKKLKPNGNSLHKHKKRTFQELTEGILLKEYTPVAVLINKTGNVLYIHGDSEMYLEQIRGYVGSANIFRIARIGLRQELITLFLKLVQNQYRVFTSNIRFTNDKEEILIDVTIKKVKQKTLKYSKEPLYLIILQPSKPIDEECNELKLLINDFKAAKDELKQINSELLILEEERKTVCLKQDNQHTALSDLNQIIANEDELESVNKNFTNTKVKYESAEIVPKKDLRMTTSDLAKIPNIPLTWISKKNCVVSTDASIKAKTVSRESRVFKSSETLTCAEFGNAREFNRAMEHGFRHNYEIRKIYIPEGVERIKGSTFFGCKNLEEVVIPSTLRYIEEFAFYGCENLKYFTMKNAHNLEYIGKSAFEKCSSMSDVALPESIIEIGSAAFLGCIKIRSVYFPKKGQLKKLGSHTFKNCESLEHLSFPPSLKYIGISSFYNCKRLKEVLLTTHLETVGEYAFCGCDSLKKIEIPYDKLLEQPAFHIGFPDSVSINRSTGSVGNE